MEHSLNATDMQTQEIRIADVMSRNLVAVEENDSVFTAAERLLKRGVGSILVMNKKDEVVGIITKGDMLREIVAKRLDAKRTKAKDVMSKQIVTINYDLNIEEASKLMIRKHVSKLPVLKDGNLYGMITSTDIIRAQPVQVEYLQQLIRARFTPKDLEY